MNPRLFLNSFWRTELTDKVFVAMPFSGGDFDERWEKIYQPAIRKIEHQGRKLEPDRVDIRKSGDSILTEINDGIAHAQLILADISVVHEAVAEDGTKYGYRNGNVMYEVGIAAACREPVELVLVRSDSDPLLFDVTSTPVTRFDPTDIEGSKDLIRSLLQDRIDERKTTQAMQVYKACRTLSAHEIDMLYRWKDNYPGSFSLSNNANFFVVNAMPHLLDLGIFKTGRVTQADGKILPGYEWTEFGRRVLGLVLANFPDIQPLMQ